MKTIRAILNRQQIAEALGRFVMESRGVDPSAPAQVSLIMAHRNGDVEQIRVEVTHAEAADGWKPPCEN